MRRASLVAALFVLLFGGNAAAQDFDPHGRHKPNGGRPNGGKPNGKPNGGKPNGGQVREPTGGAALIDRYTKIVLSQPGATFPLQRLTQLYRDKDGNIKALVSDFEARSAQSGPDQYAAAVTLAGLYRVEGRMDDATKTFDRAIALKPSDPSAILSLARLHQDRGEVGDARKRYEQALPLQTLPADREQTIRSLMALALDGKDWVAAKGFHKELVKLQPTSLFIKAELGKELFSRSEYERAEAEFRDVEKASLGDNRTLAPALKDLGRALAKQHKNDEALKTLKRALAAAGAEAAVRKEIYDTITEVYRADQKLAVLIKELEAEHPSDFARIALLASLYEETGDISSALKLYQRALTLSPRQIDLRLKVIRLLQAQGELDRAIAEYDGLIRSAPNNPEFVFEQCEALIQRGERGRAEKLLLQLEARAQSDEEVLGRLADYYARIGLNEKSVKVLTRLTQIGANDPSHLVELGDRYFQDGNQNLAKETWRRILTSVTPKARALSAYGEVLLEHDLTTDAILALKEAAQLEPQNLTHKKNLAGAYERARSYGEATTLWTELLEKAKSGNDRALARESRSHLVSMWAFQRRLEIEIPRLEKAFQGSPPDVEAGRLLGEVQIHLRRFADAEGTLRKVVAVAPGDGDSYLALERVLVQLNKLQDAILVLEKLIAAEPKRARELYQRMAQYALQLYHDDDAIKYSAQAVALNPDDAEGHRRLGEMYRSRQDVPHAINEFRTAIAKNDRLFQVYFELAELLVSRGEIEEADRLFRRVVRGAPDDELVAKAARLSLQINLGKNTLESLEQELLPLAIGNPQRPLFRRLLVELYGSLTFNLVQVLDHGEASAKTQAHEALAKIGARAIKPLLDGLTDPDVGQQRVAIEVLRYVENKNAGAPLFSYATGPAEMGLRVRAMIACGSLRDPGMLAKLEDFLLPRKEDAWPPADPVGLAATWAVTQIRAPRASALLGRLAERGTPEMRAMALLGLGSSSDRSNTKRLAEASKSPTGGTLSRAAAVRALAEIGSDADVPVLAAALSSEEPLLRESAIVGLSKMKAEGRITSLPDRTIELMVESLFSGSEAQKGARGARARLADSAAEGLALTMAKRPRDPLLLDLGQEGVGNVEALVLSRGHTAHPTQEEREAALMRYAPIIERAAKTILMTSSQRLPAVLAAFSGPDGAVLPLYDGTGDKAMRARGTQILRAIEPSLRFQLEHPEVGVRANVVALLGRVGTPSANQSILKAIRDKNEAVRRVALGVVAATSEARPTLEDVLASDPEWSLRALAAEALGRGEGGATSALQHSARTDAFALVREAALRATVALDKGAGRALAMELAKRDQEPRIRSVATELAK